MYGTPDAVQGQYETLLGVLLSGYGHNTREVHRISMRVTQELLGGGSVAPLSYRFSTEQQFVEGLKRIRARVVELLHP